MPENTNISGRKSIHERDPKTPQRENSEDFESPNESQQQPITTDSCSDLEGFDCNDTYIYSEEESRRREMSHSVPRTPERPKRALDATTTHYSPESNTTKQTQKTKVHVSKGISKIYLSAIILVGFGCVYAIFQQTGKDFKQKNCSYEKLQQQYPQEETTLWRTLKVGIESILNNRIETPVVFLFAHHGGEHVYQLVKDIAVHSSSCFGQEMRPIEMEREDFIAQPTDNDYGYSIEKYKIKIKDGNVILIANLNEIPAVAAKALHTICDTHSPIAKDVVIFLTLTIPTIVDGNVESNVEDTLIQLWGSQLGNNELQPLITRVTDQVIFLQP